MTFAAIYIPEFPVAAWLRVEARVRLHPLAVIEGDAPLERVAAFNRAAQALGLARGMSRTQAEQTGPIVFRRRSLQEEADALDSVLAVAERFSPRVQVIAGPTNEYAGWRQLAVSLLLDGSGMDHLFKTTESYARQLSAELRENGFPANIAAAPNAEAALLLARSYTGVTCVASDAIARRLARLPVASLRCDERTLAVFARWGIRTLGELAGLPEKALVSRIGQQGRRLQRLALGIEDHFLVPEEPAFTLSEHMALETPLELLDSLLFLASPMLERMIRRAMERAYGLRSVNVTLTLDKKVPHEFTIRPAVPTQSRDLLLKLLNLELQTHSPHAAILAVTLSAEPARPLVAQRGIFQAQFPEPDKLDLLLARLRSIAGEDCVGAPELGNSHRDEECRIVPFRPRQTNLEAAGGTRAARLALRRFRPQQAVRVILREERPGVLYWQGVRSELAEAAGPWQSSGYWWDGRCWEADEWDAITAHPPQAMRLRYEHGLRAWFVAGLYD